MKNLIIILIYYLALPTIICAHSAFYENKYQNGIRMEQNSNDEVLHYLILNNYYYEIGDIEKGDKSFSELKENAIGNYFTLDHLIISEEELYDSRGDFNKSNLPLIESLEKKIEIGELIKLNNTSELQNILRINENLYKRRRLAELDSKYQTYIIYMMGVVTFTLVGLITIILFQKRQQVLVNKLLVQKNRSLIHQQTNVKNIEGKNSNLLSKDIMETIFLKIKMALEKDKMFLDQEITIDKFSKSLDSNRTYVSKVIKKFYGKNFNALINEHRINEILHFFEEGLHKKFTLESLSMKAGFKSKSVFHQAFKTYTGLTPKYYIKEMEKR